jgi:hypothetical protein
VKSAFAVVALAAATAGCGGSHHSDTAEIRAALVASKASYLHYQSPLWWGRRSPARLVLVRTSGKYALAHVTLSSGPKIFRSQWALLESKPDGWRVLDVNQPRAHNLGCKAPPKVMMRLAGGCAHEETYPSGGIRGPTASRAASPSEHAAIAKAARRYFRGKDSCMTYTARVSTVNPRYARLIYVFHKPYRNCDLFNGVDIYGHTNRGWRRIEGASDPFPCASLPPGVVRSLFGDCWIS